MLLSLFLTEVTMKHNCTIEASAYQVATLAQSSL